MEGNDLGDGRIELINSRIYIRDNSGNYGRGRYDVYKRGDYDWRKNFTGVTLLASFDDLEEAKKYGFNNSYAKGGYMADGGEVDFQEKMAKMRSAYENLDMIVKSKIAMAIGIDNAVSIMDYDYIEHPFDLIKGAVRSGLLELDEINGDLVGSAIQEAERIDEDYKDSGEGIGSSDITYFTKHVLDDAGYKTAFINNRLTRVDADGNELVIDKYEMNF